LHGLRGVGFSPYIAARKGWIYRERVRNQNKRLPISTPLFSDNPPPPNFKNHPPHSTPNTVITL
jgi:hypothetical protein